MLAAMEQDNGAHEQWFEAQKTRILNQTFYFVTFAVHMHLNVLADAILA
jgi:hypothetical protein